MQLVCLARVMLEKKDIVSMDEATSSIDKRTNSIIRSVMQSELKLKTIIAIAHNLLTIFDYDEVLVFDQGVIVERGTPIELIKK